MSSVRQKVRSVSLRDSYRLNANFTGKAHHAAADFSFHCRTYSQQGQEHVLYPVVLSITGHDCCFQLLAHHSVLSRVVSCRAQARKAEDLKEPLEGS